MVNTVDPVKVTVYTLSGSAMSENRSIFREQIHTMQLQGFYIVKVTDKNGAVGTYKVLVK